MTRFPECQLVAVDAPPELDIKATALRMPGTQAWAVFVNACESEHWLCFMETTLVQPLHFDDASARFYAKASLLLGEHWKECWEDLPGVLVFQRQMLDMMGAGMRKRIEASSLDELREWRSSHECLEAGEWMRAQFTGDDPRAIRN